MKKRFTFLCLAATMMLAISCNKRPEASFTLSKTSAAVGESITATFNGQDANTYLWFLYDGTNTNAETSSHFTTVADGQRCDSKWTFNVDTSGTYTVYLKAVNYKDGCECSDCSGKNDEFTQTITIQ
jgi:hypothetical protein